MTEKDRNDLIDFAKDHIEHFNCIPLEFETATGELIMFPEILKVVDDEGLNHLIERG